MILSGSTVQVRARGGSTALSQPVQSVSIVQPDALRSLFGQEHPITAQEKNESRQRWQRLRSENAPFRIVTEMGLVSTSIEYFDPLLLAQATPEWQTAARIVGNTMGYNSDPYFQVGDLMLQARIVALVHAGRLLADGDPWSMSCRIKLPADRNRADSSV
jgi:Protein of unknown function